MKDVTFAIKTFERKECVNRLVKSIINYYPNATIHIVDDSKNPLNIFPRNPNIKIYNLPFDSGLSYGRNYLIDSIDTKYALMLDDDFVFDKSTKVDRFLEIINKNEVDLIAGNIIENDQVITYHGLLEIEDRCLTAFKGQHEENNGIRIVDLTLNFFLAKTDSIKKVYWDNNLKVGEHLDFFLRGRGEIKCAHTNEVTIQHKPVRNEYYNKFRNRAVSYMLNFMEKHELKKIDARDIGGDLWTPNGVILAVEEINSGKRNAFKR